MPCFHFSSPPPIPPHRRPLGQDPRSGRPANRRQCPACRAGIPARRVGRSDRGAGRGGRGAPVSRGGDGVGRGAAGRRAASGLPRLAPPAGRRRWRRPTRVAGRVRILAAGLAARFGVVLDELRRRRRRSPAAPNYQSNCAACHGGRGGGDGAPAEGLDPAPANSGRLEAPGRSVAARLLPADQHRGRRHGDARLRGPALGRRSVGGGALRLAAPAPRRGRLTAAGTSSLPTTGRMSDEALLQASARPSTAAAPGSRGSRRFAAARRDRGRGHSRGVRPGSRPGGDAGPRRGRRCRRAEHRASTRI